MKSSEVESNPSYQSLNRSLFLVAGLATLTVATNFLDPINLPKLIAILIPLPWLVANFYKLTEFRFDKAFFAEWPRRVFAFSLAVVLLLLLASPAPLERRLLGTWGRNNGLLTVLASVTIAWCAYELGKKAKEPISFLFWTHNILIPTAAYGLIQVIGEDPIAWSSGSMKIFATFGNTNFAAAAWALGAIASSILMFFGRKSHARTTGQRVFYLCTFFTFSYLTYMTRSIQGLFAIMVFFVILIILKFWFSRKLIFRIFSGVVTLGGLFVAHSIFFSGPLSSLISTAGSLGFRKIYWSIGVRMFLEQPIFGVGVDSYGDFYRAVRTPEMATTTSIDLVVNNAHNTFIQTLATLGVVGSIAQFLPVLTTMFFGIRYLKFQIFDARVAIFALFMSLWLMASFSIDNISITIWNWLFLGLSMGLTSRISEKTDVSPNVRRSKNAKTANLYDYSKLVVNAISLFVAFILWNNVSAADRKLVSTFRIPASFEQPESVSNRLDSLGEISRLSNLDPQHYMMLGRALVELQQVPQAIEVLSRGVIEYERDFALWDNLAYSLEQQGRFPEAINAREKQVVLDPRHARVWSYLAQDYQRNGDELNARRAAQQSIANLSVFALSDQESIREYLNTLGLL